MPSHSSSVQPFPEESPRSKKSQAGAQPAPANTPDARVSHLESLQPLLQDYREEYQRLSWQGTFGEYLDILHDNPLVARNAFQRVYDMIAADGETTYTHRGTTYTHYHFFDDPRNNGKSAVFGMDGRLMELVDTLKAAAEGFKGADQRLLILRGPVSSAKSNLVALLKQGLEAYTRSEEGAMYTFGFQEDKNSPVEWTPMHEDPIHLLPTRVKQAFVEQLNAAHPDERPVILRGGLNPLARFRLDEYLDRYNGDLDRALDHVVVKRTSLSEQERRGIATFQPNDPKNQDSTELTGSANFQALAVYGVESDPRAFSFDGELVVANRGLCEFVEIFKLGREFLYPLLTATEESRIKPPRFSQFEIDTFIVGHTNEPEFNKYRADKTMEAIQSRSIIIDIPYNVLISDEMKIYERDYAKTQQRIHFAPHTLEVAAMFAVLTRLEQAKDNKLTLAAKANLYDGKQLPGYSEHSVIELQRAAEREGFDGIEARFIQNSINRALGATNVEDGINPFMVLKAIEKGIVKHRLCETQKDRDKFNGILAQVLDEYTTIITTEVQQAIAADVGALERLFANYIDNVRAFTQGEKVRHPITQELQEPNEQLMRSIEEKATPPVTEIQKRDFRNNIMNGIAALALNNKRFDYKQNEQLRKALEAKLFDDQKDTIRLSQFTSSAVDRETQEKIDIVKSRLMRDFGYNERSASDVLEYVSSIFARGKK